MPFKYDEGEEIKLGQYDETLSLGLSYEAAKFGHPGQDDTIILDHMKSKEEILRDIGFILTDLGY